jgi:hypothetical protein
MEVLAILGSVPGEVEEVVRRGGLDGMIKIINKPLTEVKPDMIEQTLKCFTRIGCIT